MPLKFVVLSDLHIHPFKQYSYTTEHGVNSRLVDVSKALSEVASYVEKNEVDLVLLGGDIFHTKTSVSADALKIFVHFLDELYHTDASVVCVTGNHDQIPGSASLLEPFYNYDNMTLVGHEQEYMFSTITSDDNEALSVVSSTYHADTTGLLKFLPDWDVAYPRIMLGHQGIDGAVNSGEYVLHGQHDNLNASLMKKVSRTFDASFFGHFHEHQTRNKNIHIIGALTQHNWGDAGGTRGFLSGEVKDSTLSKIKHHTINSAPRFMQVDDAFDLTTLRPNDIVRYVTTANNLTTNVVDNIYGSIEASVGQLPPYVEIIPVKKDDTKAVINEQALSIEKALQAWVAARGETAREDTLLPVGMDILQEAREAK